MVPMPPVRPGEYGSPVVRDRRRLARAHRRAGWRAAWWFPPALLGLLVAGVWGLLRVDQYVADQWFWPSSGAQFIEVGPAGRGAEGADPDATGGVLTVVAGGLNRKSGTGPALALLPALAAGPTADPTAAPARVFSLVYGNGISDRDIEEKFDALIERVRPNRVDFFGSSMGGDVVLNLAAHLERDRKDGRWGAPVDVRPLPAQVAGRPEGGASRARFAALLAATTTAPPSPAATPTRLAASLWTRAGGPRVGTIYLDCTPLSAADVRNVGRTRADAITALSEALHSDGGVGVRMAAEVLGQQPQWSTGRFPFVDVRWDDFSFKVEQVWRDKISGPGISTQLVKDQYGVIRRMDIDGVAHDLGTGPLVVYFRPEVSADDRTVRVGAAEATLRGLVTETGLRVLVVPIPGGHHASAESDPGTYLEAIARIDSSGGS